MTLFGKTILFLFVSTFVATTLRAQVVIKKTDANNIEGQPFIVPELGAVVMLSDGTPTVLDVMPKDRRPKAYADIDIRRDDRIVMANARRLKTTKDLEDLHSSLAVGEELKLGIKRNDETLIVTFAKGDQKDLPKMKIMLGGGGDVEALPAIGVMLKSDKNKIIIADKLDDPSSALAKADVKEGDEIIAMNSKPAKSLRQLIDDFDSLPAASEVTWKLKRGSRTIAVRFSKPQPKGMMMKHEIQK